MKNSQNCTCATFNHRMFLYYVKSFQVAIFSGNPALNQLYLKLVNSAITRCYEQQTQLEECRHLIWLIFRHPAFTVPERATLLHWVEVFDRMFPPLQHLESESGYSSGGSDRSSSCSPSPTQDKMFVYNPGMVNQFPNLFPGFPAPPHASAPPLYQSCRRTNGMIFKRSHSEPAGQFNGRCRVQQRERSLDVTQHMTGEHRGDFAFFLNLLNFKLWFLPRL